MTDKDGWNEYRALILHEMKRLDDHVTGCKDEVKDSVQASEVKTGEILDRLSGKQDRLSAEVIKLKTQAALWGVVSASIIAALVSYFVDLIKT
jgi:hypothetical protein